MDRGVTPAKQVTSPTWGSLPPCKQALKYLCEIRIESLLLSSFNLRLWCYWLEQIITTVLLTNLLRELRQLFGVSQASYPPLRSLSW